MPQLRFGILCDSAELPAWAAACIRHVVATGRAELVSVIRDETAAPVFAWSAHQMLFRAHAARWLRRRSAALRTVDSTSELAGATRLNFAAFCAKALTESELAILRAFRLDFILSFSARRPNDQILSIPRWGVWSYRHGREVAPCFREVSAGDTKTEAVLERLSAGAAADLCLHRGFFGTERASWVDNLDRVLFGSADFCARVCAEISACEPDELRRRPHASPSRAGEEQVPDNREMIRMLLRAGAHMLAKLWELSFHVELWNVGFTTKSVAQVLHDSQIESCSVTWCKPHSPGDFVADPFAYTYEGKQHVLVEDYVQGRGRICEVMRPAAASQLELAVEIEPPYHLSYPCIFEEAGEVYCVPEAFQSGKASLYRRTPSGWELVRTLLDGLPVVDPTLFKHEGLYWLLYTLQDDGAWGSLKLYASYTDRLDGDWKPHPLNPLKCDIGSSRPAGSPLLVDGQLYRPSQDCSETYGGAVVMNRIVKLSPTEFEEVAAARIEPPKGGPYPAGLHTINAVGTGSVIDGKRFALDWFAWRKNSYLLRQMFK